MSDARHARGPTLVVAPDRPQPLGEAGGRGVRLLAGKTASDGAEPLRDHIARLGALPDLGAESGGFAESVHRSGLLGRGGSGFPVARKLATAAAAGGSPLVVVNASESEPASRKDAALLSLRPHLVLDGVAALAAAVGGDEAVIVLHRGRHEARAALVRALAERANAGLADPDVSLALGPDRYVAGESSAIVALLEGGDAKPRFSRQPAALGGVAGRPTLVHNVETVAHLALLARFGEAWFTRAGSPSSPGSTLLTLAGAVSRPGLVVEVVTPVTIGELLVDAGGLRVPPAGVLLGGYGGVWMAGSMAWETLLTPEDLGRSGASIGCGLVAVLPHGACAVAETANLLAYLARESAGQCGPCVFGLPALAESAAELAAGRASCADLRRLHRLAARVNHRGACHHPDGAVRLLESALDVFAGHVTQHLRGTSCANVPIFPIPDVVDRRWR